MKDRIKKILFTKIDGFIALKITLGIIIWASAGVFLLNRLSHYLDGTYQLIDKVIGAIFVLFTLIPFFYEIDILGIKVIKDVKKIEEKVEKYNINMRTELLDMKSYISNSATQSIQNIIEYPGERPLPDKKLDQLVKESPLASKEINKEEIDVPDIHTLCFNVRYNIEQLLSEVWENEMGEDDDRISLIKLVAILSEEGVISTELYPVLHELIVICNRGIHGKELTQLQEKFLRESYSGVIEELESLIQDILTTYKI